MAVPLQYQAPKPVPGQPRSRASMPTSKSDLASGGLDGDRLELLGGGQQLGIEPAQLADRRLILPRRRRAERGRGQARRSICRLVLEQREIVGLVLVHPDDPGHSGVIEPTRLGQGRLQQAELSDGDLDTLADVLGEPANLPMGYQFWSRSPLTPPSAEPNGLALSDHVRAEQVELDFPDDVGDAGFAGLAGREAAGFLGLAGAGPAGAVAGEGAGSEDLEQERGEREIGLLRGKKPRRCPSRRPGRAGS